MQSVMHLRDLARAIADREIYAFDRSALNAASDLRIDTPDRLERLVEAVLRSPRKIFMEADMGDLGLIGSGLRGVLGQTSVQNREGGDLRWGAIVDIEGEGRATFRLVFGLSKGWWKSTPEAASFKNSMKSWPTPMQGWAAETLDVMAEPETYSIDTSRKTGLSKHEFIRALEKIKGSQDPIFRHASSHLKKQTGVRARGRMIDAAWQAMRFRDLVRRGEAIDGQNSLLAGAQVRHLDLGRDHASLAYGLPTIAMLALLQADSSDIRTTPRSRVPSGARNPSFPQEAKNRDIADSLRVVTLNLEDRDLQGLYEARTDTSGGAIGAHLDHGGRARHPVRGHLFLARNGKMTWRKPHWRGAIEQTTIRKVVAPSHDR